MLRNSIIIALLLLILSSPFKSSAWDPFMPPQPKKKNLPERSDSKPDKLKPEIVKEQEWQYRDLAENNFVILGRSGDSFLVRFQKSKKIFHWKPGQVIKNCTMLKIGKLICYHKIYKTKNKNEKIILKPIPSGGFLNAQ